MLYLCQHLKALLCASFNLLRVSTVQCHHVVLGVYAVIIIMHVLQLLPPPFPTTKPLRLYCSNMAVSPAHRRKGLATALLQRCQRLGKPSAADCC